MSKATLAKRTAPSADMGKRGRRRERRERLRRRRMEENKWERGVELVGEGEHNVRGRPPMKEERTVPMPRRRRVLFSLLSLKGGRRAMERGGMRGRAGEMAGRE